MREKKKIKEEGEKEIKERRKGRKRKERINKN